MKKCSTARLRSLSEDPYLHPYLDTVARRRDAAVRMERRCVPPGASLHDWAAAHEHFGLHRTGNGWILREWAPNATAIALIGTRTGWEPRDPFWFERSGDTGEWMLELAPDQLDHQDLYRLKVAWDGGDGDRIPACCRRVVQDAHTKIFNAQVWAPASPHAWQETFGVPRDFVPRIYEAHVGMALEDGRIGTYTEFREQVLPRVADAGYNTLQLMAVMEHPYYGSFGYHVSNFFAPSSRFGTPEELKALIDAAHAAGLAVIMDMVHSHAVRNEAEGLARWDGTRYQYFHEGPRGEHTAWDSLCFDYGKPQVVHFLLSNCRYWLDEFRFDGFRFDGVTSMLYHHHGLAGGFNAYDAYFGDTVDEDAITYLTLANRVIHAVRPDAFTIAEDVSGMPGLAAPREDGGMGFDYRMAMGVPDMWFKLVNDTRDEDWNIDFMWHELTNRREDERTISYAESHDQALVGGKTLAFELMDAAMYEHMHTQAGHLAVDRGMALHKMIRLATLATAGHGYMNFMGNEFGHPEWVDFPRDGNDWSYHYARRQWSLRDNPDLRYYHLAEFDKAMQHLAGQAQFIDGARPDLVCLHHQDKVLAFRRGTMVFIFNFNPDQSFTDYRINLASGIYRLVLTTDDPRFAGHNRIAPDQAFHTQTHPPAADEHFITVYLPVRTALVLEQCRPA